MGFLVNTLGLFSHLNLLQCTFILISNFKQKQSENILYFTQSLQKQNQKQKLKQKNNKTKTKTKHHRRCQLVLNQSVYLIHLWFLKKKLYSFISVHPFCTFNLLLDIYTVEC